MSELGGVNHTCIGTRVELTKQARSLRSVTKESNVSPCSWRLRSNLTAAIFGFFFGFEVCLEFFGDSFKYVPFTDVMSVFPRSNLNSVPLKSEVNLSALVTDEAHQVAYFLFFHALAEWSSESKFAVLIKSFPLFTQVRGGPIHRSGFYIAVLPNKFRTSFRWFSRSDRNAWDLRKFCA